MSGQVLLGVEGLSVYAGAACLLRELSFALRAGEALTLLGESGAGKSLLAQAVMGNLPAALLPRGRVTLEGMASPTADTQARRARWGRGLALLPQEPALALDPLRRIEPQLAEVHALVRGCGGEQARREAARELDALGLSDAAQRHVWQVSGGMAQRAVAAMALAGGARVLLADEPTKGLDAYWRAHVVALLRGVLAEGGCVLTITHDLQVAQALGGRLMVLREGEVVEAGDAAQVLARPRHGYTRRLLAADPSHWPRHEPAARGAEVLRASALGRRFGDRVLFERLDLALHRSDRLVLQGASGTGKSTLGNVLLGLLPPTEGQVRRAPGLAPHALQKLYQDPVATFAPQATLEQSLRDVARLHRRDWRELRESLERLRVGEALLRRRPAQVSGGELQRVALARVLLAQPALIFADEPTSRLDPITQREALELLLEATDKLEAALVLVTHDESMARAVGTSALAFDAQGLRTAAPEPFKVLAASEPKCQPAPH